MKNVIDKNYVSVRIVNIEWERVFVVFDLAVDVNNYAKDEELEFYIVNNLGSAKAKLNLIQKENQIYRLKLNLTNNGENRCVPIGTYRIFLCCKEEVLAECEADYKIAMDLKKYGRNFLFANGNGVCAVDFYIEDEEQCLPLRMRVLLAKKMNSAFPSNKDYKIPPFYKKAWRYFSSSRVFLRNTYNICSKIWKKQRKNTILFMTEQSPVLNSNIKAVYDRIKERGLDKEYKLLVSARPAAAEPQSYRSWIILVKKLAQSGIVFLDDHAPVLDWMKLKEDTKVIQLWHAGAGFKSSGYSRWGHKGCPSPQSCHRQYTYGIAGSEQIAHFFSEVWGINDEQVLPTGMPRMDQFLNEEYRNRTKKLLYEKFPICTGKKVILFAPTYRGKNKKTAYYPYELIDFKRLYQICGDEYVVLFKMHPWVSEAVPIPGNMKDKFMDVNEYPNINDLFYFTDLLVTDYSSNIFEYSLMRKPMLFFAYDEIQYSFSRGFHRNYKDSAPGKVCHTFDELLKAIQEKDFEYDKVEEYIEHHFDFIDTHSSDRVIDWIILDKLPEKYRLSIENRKQENNKMNEMFFDLEELQKNN